jgi:hypothetical protein
MPVNPDFVCRFGNIDDLVYLEKLLMDYREHLKSSSKKYFFPFFNKDFSVQKFLSFYKHLMLDESQSYKKISLVFDQNKEIKCFSLAMFWNDNKIWRHIFMICNPKNSYFDAVKNGISDSTNMLVEYAESIGYYSYDFMLANPTNHNRWRRMKHQIPLVSDRYEFYDAAIIPANTMPEHKRYQSMMMNRTWNIDLIYRIAHLKNEYRDRKLISTLVLPTK